MKTVDRGDFTQKSGHATADGPIHYIESRL